MICVDFFEEETFKVSPFVENIDWEVGMFEQFMDHRFYFETVVVVECVKGSVIRKCSGGFEFC